MRFELVTKDHYSNKIKQSMNSQNKNSDDTKKEDDIFNYEFRVKSDLEIYAIMSILNDIVSNI